MNVKDEKNGIAVPKRPAKPLALSLLILLSGILIGAGLTFIIMQRQVPKPPPGPEYFSERWMRHLAGELQLTEEQKQKLEPIIQEHFKVMEKIRAEARPKIAAEIEQMNQAISTILTEPQKKIWEERQQRMREGFGRGPGQRRRGPDEGERRGDDERRGDRDGRPRWRGQDPNRPPRPEQP
ncbi:MAG: periplasmic heavy metal sensor [Planctomycetaceae bacterium]|nr:periplasmic heavy metal sensor [Planctomycetaceae bacterium]